MQGYRNTSFMHVLYKLFSHKRELIAVHNSFLSQNYNNYYGYAFRTPIRRTNIQPRKTIYNFIILLHYETWSSHIALPQKCSKYLCTCTLHIHVVNLLRLTNQITIYKMFILYECWFYKFSQLIFNSSQDQEYLILSTY